MSVEWDENKREWVQVGPAPKMCRCGPHRGPDAAGVLLSDGHAVLLQLRSSEVDHGRTWGLPGGLLYGGESPAAGALREAAEEVGGVPWAEVDTRHAVRTAHTDGWAYTTIVARAARQYPATNRAGEGLAVEWVPVGEVKRRNLHPGFAADWPSLRLRLPKPTGPAPGGGRPFRHLSREVNEARGDVHPEWLPAHLTADEVLGWRADVVMAGQMRSPFRKGDSTARVLESKTWTPHAAAVGNEHEWPRGVTVVTRSVRLAAMVRQIAGGDFPLPVALSRARLTTARQWGGRPNPIVGGPADGPGTWVGKRLERLAVYTYGVGEPERRVLSARLRMPVLPMPGLPDETECMYLMALDRNPTARDLARIITPAEVTG